jgi:alcohol dehydrogenase class IV
MAHSVSLLSNHTTVPPHALAYNAPTILGTMAELAEALADSNGDTIGGLNMLLRKLKIKTSLASFGFQEVDIALPNSTLGLRPIEKD